MSVSALSRSYENTLVRTRSWLCSQCDTHRSEDTWVRSEISNGYEENVFVLQVLSARVSERHRCYCGASWG